MEKRATAQKMTTRKARRVAERNEYPVATPPPFTPTDNLLISSSSLLLNTALSCWLGASERCWTSLAYPSPICSLSRSLRDSTPSVLIASPRYHSSRSVSRSPIVMSFSPYSSISCFIIACPKK